MRFAGLSITVGGQMGRNAFHVSTAQIYPPVAADA
jgi:hypothetical protein